MTNEPTDNHTHTHERFIPDSDESDYPTPLRITALPAEQAHAAILDRLER